MCLDLQGHGGAQPLQGREGAGNKCPIVSLLLPPISCLAQAEASLPGKLAVRSTGASHLSWADQVQAGWGMGWRKPAATPG